jgi:hypothetical protein
VNSLLSILLITIVMPRVPKNAERLGLMIAFVACLLGAGAFLFLGPGMLWIVLLVQGLGSAAFLLFGTYRDSVFMNSVEEAKKAELFGLVNMLAMLLSIPTGWLAGWLYSVNPLAPFGALVGLFGLGTVAALSLIGHHRRATTPR